MGEKIRLFLFQMCQALRNFHTPNLSLFRNSVTFRNILLKRDKLDKRGNKKRNRRKKNK